MKATTTHDIVVAGFNPAWQKTLRFDAFRYKQINRASSLFEISAGKGINVVRALRAIGADGVVVQFAGGPAGDLVCDDLDAEGVPHVTVRTEGSTRTCTTILSEHDRSMTELIEPSGEVSDLEVEAVAQRLLQQAAGCRCLAVCGTYPPGVPPEIYARVIAKARARALVCLDAWRGVVDALEAGPHILKVNVSELQELTGCTTADDAARTCFDRWPVAVLALTAGPGNAFLYTRRRGWCFSVPPISDIESPLGAGDCATGVFLYHTLAQLSNASGANTAASSLPARLLSADLTDPFRRALAAATASCLTDVPARFSPEAAEEILPDVHAAPLPAGRWAGDAA